MKKYQPLTYRSDSHAEWVITTHEIITKVEDSLKGWYLGPEVLYESLMLLKKALDLIENSIDWKPKVLKRSVTVLIEDIKLRTRKLSRTL